MRRSNSGGKPANWKEPVFFEKGIKVTSYEENLETIRRNGAPPTRGGDYNGHRPGLRPGFTKDNGPDLVVSKAVLAPVKYTPGGGSQFQRKRDASGKFTQASNLSQQTTAEEDQVNQQRDVKLQQHRMLDRLHGKDRDEEGEKKKEETKKALPPGSSGADTPMSGVNDSNSTQVLGNTSTGKQVFDDPFHSGHSDFTDQEHQEAAKMNQGMANMYQQSGDQPSAMKYNANAQAHQSAASDSQPPGARFMDNSMNPNTLVGGDMNGFLDLLGQDQSQGMPQQGSALPQPQDMGGIPGMQQDSMAATTQGAPNPNDDLSMLMNPQQPPQYPDQNKPQLNNPSMAGPKPGMYDTRTGSGVGPQTDNTQIQGGSQTPVSFDLDSMFSEDTPDFEEDPQAAQEAQGGQDMESDDSDDGGMFGGGSSDSESDSDDSGSDNPFASASGPDDDSAAPGAGPGSDAAGSDDDKKKQAFGKAIKALSRYL